MDTAYRIGIIGLGHMGKRYFEVLQASARWQLAAVCDRNPERLNWARRQAPELRASADAEELFGDASLDAIGLFTLADVRPGLVRSALAAEPDLLALDELSATRIAELANAALW